MLCAIYVVLFGSFPLRYLILHMLPPCLSTSGFCNALTLREIRSFTPNSHA